MTGARRRYSGDEKRRAVDMILGEGRTAVSVSRDLGVGTASLRRWCVIIMPGNGLTGVAVLSGGWSSTASR
jgi:transposase-like protein